MIERILKSFWLHPFRWLLGVSLIFISFFVICSGNKEEAKIPPKEINPAAESPREAPSASVPSVDPSNGSESPSSESTIQIPKGLTPDPDDPIQEDETQADIIQGEKIAAERAALPFLPLKTPSVEAEYINQLETGDLLIEVRYRGTKKEAIAVWQRFLDKYQDPGTAYLVVYEPE